MNQAVLTDVRQDLIDRNSTLHVYLKKTLFFRYDCVIYYLLLLCSITVN